MHIPPNLLFIQVDQLTAASLRAYGDGACHAPNLDQLAETGAVFDTVYCNFPLCAPSRFSMAAGQLCSTIGAYDNAAEMAASVPTYAHYLRQVGYQTALSGKMHFIGPDQYHGFETRLTPDLYPADFSWVPNWANEGKRDTNDPRAVLTSGVCKRSVQIDFDERVTFCAVQHLFDIARSADERPFFLQVSYTHPHEPYLCLQRFWNLYADREIPLPAVGMMDEAQHDPHSARLLKDFGMLGLQFPDEDVRRARRAYYGSISYIDSMIGTLIETLEATGVKDNTVIVFTSDHGEMLGERGMWFKKHFFEPALRVPLFLNAPWIAPQRIKTIASLVDLLPTFMGLATGQTWSSPTEPLEGIDLTAFLDRPEPDPDRVVFAEYLAEATPAPIFMVRQGRHKFIHSSHDGSLLFDVVADPHEQTNLAGNPAHAEAEAALRAIVAGKWDEATLTRDILRSQARRLLVRAATQSGPAPRWNHGERSGENVPWYRGQGSYNAWAFDYLP